MKGKSDNYYTYRKFSKTPVTIKEYREISDKFINFIIDKLAIGEVVRLPEGLGELAFIGKKIKPKINDNGNIEGLTVDWKSTKELWEKDEEAKQFKKLVYYFNEHTCGYRYRFIWFQKGCVVKNKLFYTFVSCRALKRKFAKFLINEQREFMIHERCANYKISIKQ